MENYLLGLAGIVVSIGLYYLGYRQTIGARKERIHNCNNELEKILMRRIVLENFHPNSRDLIRLANGKAYEYGIRPRDLNFDLQVLDNIYTKIFENDFLSPERREEILHILSVSTVEIEREFEEEIQVEEHSMQSEKSRSSSLIALIMGLLASLVGAFVFLVPNLTNLAGVMLPMVVSVFLISLLIISILVLYSRLKETQEEPSATSTIKSAQEFEREVFKTLEKTGAKIFHAKMNAGFDFIVMKGEHKYLVVVKAANSRPNMDRIKNTISKLNHALQVDGAQEAIIITKAPVKVSEAFLKTSSDGSIHFMSLREARDYFAEMS